MILRASLITLLSLGLMSQVVLAKDLTHDAEYYVVAAQNGEKWASDDKATAKRLADLREANGGKPPNIVYILLDDLGYG